MSKPQNTINPSGALALLKGIAEDYARLLQAHGNQATAGMVSGVATEAFQTVAHELSELEMVRVQLRTLRQEHDKRVEETNRLAKADTEILPQSLEIEVGK